MKIELSEEQKLLRENVRRFAAEVVAPRAKEIDESGEFPRSFFDQAGELGLGGVAIPEEHGGAGMDTIAYCLVIEEVSRVCATSGVILSVNNSLVCDPLLKFGTEEQKQEFLTPLAAGEKLGCFALTEPGAGSDPAGLRTTARRDGDDYVLNGNKVFITNGTDADVALVFASVDLTKKHKGITCFIVPTGTPGYSHGTHEFKLGVNASGTTELAFDDMRIPARYRLGGDADAPAVQGGHGDLEAVPLLAEAVAGRDPQILERQLGGARGVDAKLELVGPVAVARSVRGDDEAGDPLVLLLQVDAGEDQGDIRVGAVGDEDLVAVEDVVVAVAAGRGAYPGRIAAGARLGEGEAAELPARGQGGEEFLLLLLGAELQQGVADQGVVDREDDPGGGADPADLLDDEAVGDRVHAGAAVLLRHRHSGEAELAGLIEKGARELAALVDLLGAGTDDLLGEPPDALLQHLLLFTELDSHGFPFTVGWHAGRRDPDPRDRSNGVRGGQGREGPFSPDPT